MLTRASRDVELADRLHSAAIHLLRRVARDDLASGLGGPALSALSVIVFGGPISLSRLADAERVRPPTMTRTVQGLEAAGLVVREADADDRRVVNLRATRRGERVLHSARARRVEVLAKALRTLPARDLETLERGAELLEEVAAT